jgi:hypothetical protein
MLLVNIRPGSALIQVMFLTSNFQYLVKATNYIFVGKLPGRTSFTVVLYGICSDPYAKYFCRPIG